MTTLSMAAAWLPLSLAILLVVQWRRMSPRVAAATADRRLGLKDRLFSYLDFSRRADVDPSYREAMLGLAVLLDQRFLGTSV